MTASPPAHSGARQRDSRVLVLSQRNLHAPVHHALQYELEDLVAALDDADVVAPPVQPWEGSSRMSRQALNGALRRLGGTRRSPPWNRPSMARTPVTADHDLFFAVFTDTYQLSYLHRIPGWRERSRRAACLLFEVWGPGVEQNADYLRLLAQFDAVYLMTPDAGPALTALGSPLPRYLPPGLDTLTLSPGRPAPRRVLDVYSFGRTAPDVHAQLLRLVEEEDLAYVYDTLSHASALDHLAHRRLLASTTKRSRFFLAHSINDDPTRRQRTGGEEALSTRYFEGAAAGSVMLGSRPDSPHFDECFDWPDAVIDLPWDGADVRAALLDLSAQPERLARVRAASIRGSLQRHDWLHRWETVLRDAGLPTTPAMRERAGRLECRAADVHVEELLQDEVRRS